MTDIRDIDRLWGMVDDIRICMLSTYDGSVIRSRPMYAIPVRTEGAIWFFTDIRAHKDDELRAHPEACLGFADKDDNSFASLSGRATIHTDRTKIKLLWNEHVQAWFPDGPDSPNVALLRFEPLEGEYWDGPSSGIVTTVKMAAAIVTGDRPDMGDNAKVSFGR